MRILPGTFLVLGHPFATTARQPWFEHEIAGDAVFRALSVQELDRFRRADLRQRLEFH
jgi:hypothetical protein